MDDDSLFCTECGKPMPQGKVCPNCGVSINSGDLFCLNCGNKIIEVTPNTETNLVQSKCPKCGTIIDDNDIFCQNCGCNIKGYSSSGNDEETHNDASQSVTNTPKDPSPTIVFSDNTDKSKPYKNIESSSLSPSVPVSQANNPSPSIQEPEPFVVYQEKEKSNATLIILITLLLIAACGVGGYFYYDKIYLPEKIDREAPRYYTMANVVVLRSSRSAGADFNKVASLPYGTELITYDVDSEWARVKVNSQNGEKQEGFVASPYILNKADFFLMNSIFGNQDSKETIITTKCRLALLNYFKEKQYIGKIDDQMRLDVGISTIPNSENQWQVFTKPKDTKPNSVLFKRLYNKNSQFTDFAVIITNTVTRERKLLYFYFDDGEIPYLLDEQNAPSDGYIIDANYDYDYYSGSRELNISYSY